MNLEKYSRNILLDEIDIKGQEEICNSSILCIGCGGLASFTLPLLVASGIKKIGIVDFDTIDISNLPRQIMFTERDIGKYKVDVAKEYLQKLNPHCTIEIFKNNHTIAKNIIKNYDAIADLTDSKASRTFANQLSLQYKKPFFTGSAIGFQGHVYSFGNHLPHKPCYECLFGEDVNENDEQCSTKHKNSIVEDYINNTFQLRKQIFEENLNQTASPQTCGNSGVFPPIVATVGSMIASEILKHLAGIPLNFTTFLLLDLLSHNRQIKLVKDPSCQCSQKL